MISTFTEPLSDLELFGTHAHSKIHTNFLSSFVRMVDRFCVHTRYLI